MLSLSFYSDTPYIRRMLQQGYKMRDIPDLEEIHTAMEFEPISPEQEDHSSESTTHPG